MSAFRTGRGVAIATAALLATLGTDAARLGSVDADEPDLARTDVGDDLDGVAVEFATGDDDNFLGSGDYLVRPFLVASRTFRSIGGSPLNLTPHVNLGYQWNVNYRVRSAL